MPFWNASPNDIEVKENSVLIGRQIALNFIDSASLTWDITEDATENEIEIRGTATGSGSGENNTASNLGTGTGLFKSKVGVDLQFKSLTAGSSKLTITNNTNDVGLDVSVTKSDVGLGNVENTALSTWAGTSNITTLGTITTGTWNATTLGVSKGGTGQTTASDAINALLPTQTGNSGKYLTTNGTAASWATVTGGSGETNTASNLKANDPNFVAGLFKQKTGVDLEFYSLESVSSAITLNPSAGADSVEIGFSLPGHGHTTDDISDYINTADAAISTSITWTGTTAPSGASSLRVLWSQIGKIVLAQVRLEYASAGSALTQVTINWPTGLPTPASITGWGNSEVGIAAAGGLSTAPGTALAASRCFIQNDGSGNKQIVVVAASAAYRCAFATLNYIAA